MGTKTQGRMKCRYCNVELAPLRSLTDGEFCSDDHRRAFQARGSGADARSVDQSGGGNSAPTAQPPALEQRQPPPQQFTSAFDFQVSSNSGSKGTLGLENAGPARSVLVDGPTESNFTAARESLLSGENGFSQQPNGAAQNADSGESEVEASAAGAGASGGHPSQEVLGSWRWLNAAWH